MQQIGRFQTKEASERAASLHHQHGGQALDVAHEALIGAVRAGDDTEANLLCETCLILLRMR